MRLTDTFVSRAKSEKDTWFSDDECPGLKLRVRASGEKSFYLDFYLGKARKQKQLAKVGELTLEQARELAREWKLDIKKGNDPTVTIARKHDQPTLNEFATWYLDEYVTGRKKGGSIVNDRSLLNRHILPKLGELRLIDMQFSHVAKLHLEMSKRQPVNANRAVSLLSRLLNLAEVKGWRQHNSNFCRSVERNKEFARTRMLSRDELLRLARAIKAYEAEPYPWKGSETRPGRSQVGDLIRLLLRTGARCNELLSSQRRHIVFHPDGGGVIIVPDHKGRRAADQDRDPISKAIGFDAVSEAIIRRLMADCESDWLFPSPRREDQPMTEPKAAWEEIRERAGLEDVHMHDLRAVFTTLGARGVELKDLSIQLDHADEEVTRKHYLRHDPEKLIATASRVSTALPEELA